MNNERKVVSSYPLLCKGTPPVDIKDKLPLEGNEVTASLTAFEDGERLIGCQHLTESGECSAGAVLLTRGPLASVELGKCVHKFPK